MSRLTGPSQARKTPHERAHQPPVAAMKKQTLISMQGDPRGRVLDQVEVRKDETLAS